MTSTNPSQRSESAPKVYFTFYSRQWPSGNQVEVGNPRWVPMIPRKGEMVTGPDDFGSYRVEDVDYVYSEGLYSPPTIYVRCVKPGAFD